MFQITEVIFLAFLRCETKSFLVLTGENESPSDLVELERSSFADFKRRCHLQLRSHCRDDECLEGLPLPRGLARSQYRLLLDCLVQTQDLQSCIHALERAPSAGKTGHKPYIPIRLVPNEKLAEHDKVLLGFDAVVMSAASGKAPLFGKLIYGCKQATTTVKLAPYVKIARSVIASIASQQASQQPPKLTLNKHCAECGFQERCRQSAVASDDLSLLSGIPEKEMRRLNKKGITSVTQLSYTFRPRRRQKRSASQPDKHSFALKALAIRENKIHIAGRPELRVAGTPVYLDVEGVPGRDFYYLIGFLTPGGTTWERHSLWADDVSDEKEMWKSFLRCMGNIDNPQLIHYGSYETTFLKRMKDRYDTDTTSSLLTGLIDNSLNALKVIYAKIYFPTYTNGLKDIAKYLGFRWSHYAASGINALMWRLKWESSRDPVLKQKLITYNAEDCRALEQVTNTIAKLCDEQTRALQTNDYDIVDVDSMKREKLYPIGRNEFVLPDLEQINKAAYWDYQRNRIYLRSSHTVRSAVQQDAKRRVKRVHVNTTIELQTRPARCPRCGAKKVEKHSAHSRIVQDLRFSRSAIKRWIVRYSFQRYLCCTCGTTFNPVGSPSTKNKYGPDLRSYILYQIIELRVPQIIVESSLRQLFGINVGLNGVHRQKTLAGRLYEDTYKGLLKKLVAGQLIHADETKVSVRGQNAYVWVFASHEAVAYVYTDSREGDMVRELLQDFKGVLVSDFYTAYDSIDCPQQKCLIHLIRDLNEDVLKQPFNEELMGLVREFTVLLKPIIDTIDRFGLKTRFLRKHKVHVARFNRLLSARTYKTDEAAKYQKRFAKNAPKLFTFLDYDNVPWNNNNAEHAVKPFAKLRHVIGGMSTPKGIREYLILLSICETCKYRGISYLDFLRSGEKDLDQFMTGRHSSLQI